MPDSTIIKGFSCDYTLFNDDAKILKQEVFDSKKIKVRREFLEMIFLNLPKDINFPLTSNLRTTVSDISNDTIISGKQTKVLDEFVRGLVRKKDSTVKKKSDLEKVAKNKGVQLGLNILKKGVDFNIHITTDISEFSKGHVADIDLSLNITDFDEIEDFDDFLDALPQGGSGGDFDD